MWETKAPGRKPRGHRENVQTPHTASMVMVEPRAKAEPLLSVARTQQKAADCSEGETLGRNGKALWKH